MLWASSSLIVEHRSVSKEKDANFLQYLAKCVFPFKNFPFVLLDKSRAGYLKEGRNEVSFHTAGEMSMDALPHCCVAAFSIGLCLVLPSRTTWRQGLRARARGVLCPHDGCYQKDPKSVIGGGTGMYFSWKLFQMGVWLHFFLLNQLFLENCGSFFF